MINEQDVYFDTLQCRYMWNSCKVLFGSYFSN